MSGCGNGFSIKVRAGATLNRGKSVFHSFVGHGHGWGLIWKSGPLQPLLSREINILAIPFCSVLLNVFGMKRKVKEGLWDG